MNKITVLNGDVFDCLKTLPNDSIDCCITSPPYWALRDYQINGQIGLEETPQEYINKIADIFDEVKRVLKPTGTCWLNLGDSYYSKSGSGKGSNYENIHKELDGGRGLLTKAHTETRGKFNDGGWLQPKQRLLIPSRIAIEMQLRGWILRNEIIWHKRNHMPSSVQDRFANSFEYLFFFVKNKDYYFDLDSVREKHKWIEKDNLELVGKLSKFEGKNNSFNQIGRKREERYNPLGKNPDDYVGFSNELDVIETTLEPCKESHFAVFPRQLIRRPIMAGCPKEVCIKCEQPKQAIYEKIGLPRERDKGKQYNVEKNQSEISNISGNKLREFKEKNPDKFIGFKTCDCFKAVSSDPPAANFKSGTVLDIFGGSGTTALEAREQGKDCILIELNPTYIEVMRNRLFAGANPLFNNQFEIKTIKGDGK